MSAPKPGLDASDLQILGAYAHAGARELYFNHLAQKQGNDAYGLRARERLRNGRVAMRCVPLMAALVVVTVAASGCVQAETPRKPPRLLTNEEGCSITIHNLPIDPYQVPAPLERACVGPDAIELPRNYFYSQMGPEHDGSFSLALEYPSLQPFKPGERIDLTADMAVRTVSIRYSYLSRVEPAQLVRDQYTPTEYELDGPSKSLEDRIEGDAVHGLTPYYIDMEKVRAFYRAEGMRETAGVMEPSFHTDWFVSRDASGTIDQVIKCTPREITESGVEYRDGKMVKKRVVGFAECDQTFIIDALRTVVRMNYPREGLANWRQMRARATALLVDNIVKNKKR